jgi:hypothetical protein
MEVDEITVPSPDFPAGLTFGPVTLEDVWEGALDLRHELPVTMTPRCRRFLGIRWYRETYRTRGVFHVTRDRITFRPTTPVSIDRAPSWRRFGYWLLMRGSPRRRRAPARSATNR